MAIDTREKRFSMLNFGDGNHFHATFEADGTVDLDDRQHLLDCYSGIAFAVAVPPVAPVVLAGGGGRIELRKPTRIPRRSDDLRQELEKLFGLVQEALPEQVEQQRAEIKERITKDKARVQRAVPVLDPPALAQFNLLIQRIEAIVDRKVEQVREQEEENILFLL